MHMLPTFSGENPDSPDPFSRLVQSQFIIISAFYMKHVCETMESNGEWRSDFTKWGKWDRGIWALAHFQ